MERPCIRSTRLLVYTYILTTNFPSRISTLDIFLSSFFNSLNSPFLGYYFDELHIDYFLSQLDIKFGLTSLV